MIRNDDTVLVSGDKESCVVVMRKTDYINKMQGMIDDGIVNGLYKVAEDKTLTNLKHFKDFLYRNFKNYEKYADMVPTSNQPA